MMPPMGRTAKPMPRVAKEANRPMTGLTAGKKASLRYSDAAVPKPMKS